MTSISQCEWDLHKNTEFEDSELSYYGWCFVTISVNITFIGKMMESYKSFMNSNGWANYDKFDIWLYTTIDEIGFKTEVKVPLLEEYNGLFFSYYSEVRF